tara:strand:- start:22848 stop:23552 length:705 start_codon:yes stop_codon:yes gene_type:complete
MGAVRQLGDFVENKFLGGDAADAAKEAADIQSQTAIAQAEATKEATAMTVEEQRLAREQSRADLQPFVDFGSGFMDQTKQAVGTAQNLFTDPSSIMENPFFTALQEDTRRQNLQNAAVGGRLGTGGTLAGLENAATRTGFDILNSERTAQLQNASFLSNLVGGGQNAAAGQGASSMNAANAIGNTTMSGNQAASNLMTGSANAQAAGVVGAANAQSQGISNMFNLGATLYGAGS